MITDKLKIATRSAHQRLEKLVVTRIREIRTVDHYMDLLKSFYGFYHPLELHLQSLLQDGPLHDLEQRRKSQSLLNDIRSVSERNEIIDLCRQVPVLYNTGQALGSLYVFEGSTLGGIYIVRMVRERLPLVADHAFSFFNGYGHDTEHRWNLFKTTLNDYAVNDHLEKAVIDGANMTFSRFENWISNN